MTHWAVLQKNAEAGMKVGTSGSTGRASGMVERELVIRSQADRLLLHLTLRAIYKISSLHRANSTIMGKNKPLRANFSCPVSQLLSYSFRL